MVEGGREQIKRTWVLRNQFTGKKRRQKRSLIQRGEGKEVNQLKRRKRKKMRSEQTGCLLI